MSGLPFFVTYFTEFYQQLTSYSVRIWSWESGQHREGL